MVDDLGLDSADNPGTRLARLRATSARLATLDEERRGEMMRRDELVRLLRDDDTPWSAIAAAARKSIARCVAIVAGDAT